MSATALYKALIEAKVSEETAEKAVEGLVSANEAATKADLKAGLAELEIRMVKWNVATHLTTVALIIAAIKLL